LKSTLYVKLGSPKQHYAQNYFYKAYERYGLICFFKAAKW